MGKGLRDFILTYRNTLYVTCFFLLCFGFYQPFISSLPLGVHNWAQSDRFSVASMYQDHNNFFTARTHNLSSLDGRCGVEFPIIQYISAKLGNVLGDTRLPEIYRLFNFFILSLGFLFFIKQWKGCWLDNRIIATSIFFSPVVFFYGLNFLPDTAGLGLVFLSFGYFIRYHENIGTNNVLFALFFAALATLIKTTCGLTFLSLLGAFSINALLKKETKLLIKICLQGLVSIAVIVGYDYYFFHKINHDFYSRIFMSKQQPIESLTDLHAVIKGFHYWFGQYLTIPQLLLLISLIFTGIATRKRWKLSLKPVLFISFYGIGLLIFIALLGKQFINHDYYFIASIVPLFAFLVWYSSKSVKYIKVGKPWMISALTILTLTTISLSVSSMKPRMQSHFLWKKRDIITDIEWMQNGAQIISKTGIKSDDKLFICYDPAPNTALVYFKRRGKVFNHEEMTRDSANMKYWSERIKPQYYIVPERWVSKLKNDQPWLSKRLVLFAKRPNFYIYKPLN